MAEAPGTIKEQRVRLSDSLLTLKTKVLSLPKTLPEVHADSPIARYFTNLVYDVNEGLYDAVDCAWTQTFWSEYTQAKWEVLVLNLSAQKVPGMLYDTHFRRIWAKGEFHPNFWQSRHVQLRMCALGCCPTRE
jgi:hypothetical protein